MLPFARGMFKIIGLKLKVLKLSENSKLDKCSICRQKDNENIIIKN